jgi:hypothetical protein
MVWRLPVLFALAAATAVPVTPAWAGRHHVSIEAPLFPIEHVVASAMADRQERTPYAMNYTDQAAQSLGVTGGRWEAFDTGRPSSDPLMPALRGEVDGGGAMIRLQWR